MNVNNIFGKYQLSNSTLERLDEIREALKDDIAQANPLWKLIAGENEDYVDDQHSSVTQEDKKEEEVDDKQLMLHTDVPQFPASQFFFSQIPVSGHASHSVSTATQVGDVVEFIYEKLECDSGKFEIAHLENLTTEEFLNVISSLQQRLSPKGIYSLCSCMCEVEVEQRLKYTAILCSHLLLPRVIALEEPCRLITLSIRKCVENFYTDVHKLILLPILNVDLKDTTVVNAIVESYKPHEKSNFLSEFLALVAELKAWHIVILQKLLSVKVDEEMYYGIIKLLSDKALLFSKDKNFGKLLLSFLKVNTITSLEQIDILWYIVKVNESTFKRAIEIILKRF